MENITKSNAEVKQLLNSSADLLKEECELWAIMEDMAKGGETSLNIPKWLFYKIKEYQYYYGLGWTDGNPLVLEKGLKFKDRVSPIFIRLLKAVQTLRAIDNIEFLQPYLDALAEEGITITIDPKHKDIEPISKDRVDKMQEVVDSMKDIQAQICQIADILRDEKSQQAEDLRYVPKREFRGMVDLYCKTQENKLKEDKVRKWQWYMKKTSLAIKDITGIQE